MTTTQGTGQFGATISLTQPCGGGEGTGRQLSCPAAAQSLQRAWAGVSPLGAHREGAVPGADLAAAHDEEVRPQGRVAHKVEELRRQGAADRKQARLRERRRTAQGATGGGAGLRSASLPRGAAAWAATSAGERGGGDESTGGRTALPAQAGLDRRFSRLISKNFGGPLLLKP